MKTNELLRRYVRDRSETAFAELVKQYVDLVYSAALRQVNGNVSAAQDVAQAVFIDLAHKAPRLTRHTALAGWLYNSTRFRAANWRRGEQRRHSYETQAHEMNQILHSSESSAPWHELRPLIDDAMHDLSSSDREAVLMRYFERLPLAEMGARLGIKDNTAHMRVERAMERLRAALAKRGVTSTTTALEVALAGNVVGAAPVGFAVRVSAAAHASAAATGGIVWGLLKLAGAMPGKSALTSGVAVILAAVLVPVYLATQNNSVKSNESRPAAPTPMTSAAQNSPMVGTVSDTNKNISDNELDLRMVMEDTGAPVANASFLCAIRGRDDDRRRNSTNTTDSTGHCKIAIARKTADLLMISVRTDGIADMSVVWYGEKGDKIPPRYTMQVERSVPISGRVVDEAGQPVAGATVEARGNSIPVPLGKQASPQIQNFAQEWAVTGADGRWQINRFGRSTVANIFLRATHPDFIEDTSEVRYAGTTSEKQLLDGTFVYKLDRGIAIYGTIVDANGLPVSGARVDLEGEGRTRSTTNQSDGTFSIDGCEAGSSLLTVSASGFATSTLKVEITRHQEPFRIEVKPGTILRLRIVDTNGAPVPDTVVRVNPEALRDASIFPRSGLYEWNTGADGRITWDSAPAGNVLVTARAEHYQIAQNLLLPADGVEHPITLHGARKISGTVRDFTTGRPLSPFRITAGHIGAPGGGDPEGGGTNVRWMMRGNEFLDGKFTYPDGNTGIGAKYKFEADGYVPFVTRVIGQDEGEVSLDVALMPSIPIVVTVLTPDGRPATNALVGLEIPGERLNWIPGGFSAAPNNDGVLACNEAGKFNLPEDDTITQVYAASPDGYAASTPAALATASTMQLQPWGRIEGTFVRGGKPVAGRRVTIAREDPDLLTILQFAVETDAAGHFVFPQVPPGEFRLCEQVAGSRFPQFNILNTRAIPVQLGKTSQMPVDVPVQ
jgi:RNA polymerase sigma factor (sigma-70 family)